MHLSRRLLLAAAALIPLPAMAADDDPWPGLASEIFGGRTLEPAQELVSLEAPYRAEDAAIVPLTVRMAPSIRRLTLVIDRNPVPVAAVFELGPEAGIGTIATRVRVNEYTVIHAVGETAGGRLLVSEKFVKAAGGCSAPALKDRDEAMASLGRMKFRQFERKPGAAAEAQLMIRHPNHSGFQRDLASNSYIPPRYVSDISLRQGGRLLLRVSGGISLSEDPNIRFSFAPAAGEKFTAEIVDSAGTKFSAEWPAGPGGSSI